MSKLVKLVIAALLMAIGVVWFFQGIGSLAGSPMTGVSFWAFAGVITFVIGLFLVVRSTRGSRASQDD